MKNHLTKNDLSPDFIEIIKRSLKITFRYRWLWLLGIMIALALSLNSLIYLTSYLIGLASPTYATSAPTNLKAEEKSLVIWSESSELDDLTELDNLGEWQDTLDDWGENWGPDWDVANPSLGDIEPLERQIEQNEFLASIIFLSILFILLLIVFLASVSRNALIDAIFLLDSKLSASFRNSFKYGLGKFFRIIGIKIIAFLIMLGSLLVVATTFLIASVNDNQTTNIILLILGALALALIVIILRVVTRFAILFAIIADFPVFIALGAGYQLLRKKFTKVLLSLLVSLLLNLILKLLIFILFLFLLFLGILLTTILGFILESTGVTIGIILAFILILSGIIFVQNLKIIFVNSFWVLVFKDLAGQKIETDEADETLPNEAKVIANP